MSENENCLQMLNRIGTMPHQMDRIERMLLQQTLHDKEILSTKETALYLGCSVRTVYRLRHKHHLPGFSPNRGRLYFYKKEIYNWIMSEDSGKNAPDTQQAPDFEPEESILTQQQDPDPEDAEEEELARMIILNPERD